jgi:hypothetical protein
MKDDVFENLRKIHKWTSEIRNGMTEGQKKKALGEILLSLFDLLKSLNTNLQSIAEVFKDDRRDQDSFNQIALLSTMASCFINLTHFLKDKELSIEEYRSFIFDLTDVGQQAGFTCFDDMETSEAEFEVFIHRANSEFKNIQGTLGNLFKA